MRPRSCRQATALFSIAIATSAIRATLANPVDPLGYSDALDFFPILQRDVTCPANYFSCEDKGEQFQGACCENGQVCSLDAHQSAACCPTTATCTGVAPGGGATATPSYVSNSYFTFPVIPTSFSNAAACTTALHDCSDNYDSCVQGLQGGNAGYGVTIQVPGAGGTTLAQAQTTLPSATATSVCSALSLSACHGLSNGLCHAGSQGGFTVGSENGAPRPTAACVAGVMAGVGLGIMGGRL
ncbi:hypothetical protein F4801DRAFT_389108 [Xylaria longipes]|nr:hypothetical protein F4801DRAFT_389108 [Xylaria longipes]RYC54249.1 hypothetical protein CHU98_g11960 [Xylaria longipes]